MAELEKYPTQNTWPHDIPRMEIIGLCRIWRGYLEVAGLLEKKIITHNTPKLF